LSARDISSHCNVASFRISGRHLFPCEDVRKMEQVLDFSFIDSETRKIYGTLSCRRVICEVVVVTKRSVSSKRQYIMWKVSMPQ
jgi:hypothetical protein